MKSSATNAFLRQGMPLLAAAGFLLFPLAGLGQTTELRWKLSPGQNYQHQLSQESTTSVNIGGNAIDSNSTLTIDNQWSVGQVDAAGNAEMTQTTSRVKMKIASPMGEINVDTAADMPPADSIGKQLVTSLTAMTKSKILFKMSPLGEVSDVRVAAPEGSPRPGGDPMTEMLGKDGISSMVKQSMQLVPKEPVKPGTSWKNMMEVKLPLLGKVATDSKLVYDGPVQVDGKKLEQIQVETSTTVLEKPGANQNIQFAIKDQSEKGTVYFDNQAGRFSHSEATQVMTLEVSFMGQKFDQTVRTVRKAVLRPAGG